MRLLTFGFVALCVVCLPGIGAAALIIINENLRLETTLAVPEPSIVTLFILGLICAGLLSRRDYQ